MQLYWVTIVAAALSLSACVPDTGGYGPSTGGGYYNNQPTYYGGGYGGGYNRPDYDDDRLSRRQQQALNEGCEDKYSNSRSKRNACKNQQTDGWRDALKNGCRDNYANDKKALRRCLSGL
ncbi:hypothetical protein ACFSM5_03550 [Lacibacterium aquatile]|uniref:Lipoprotein n=1 Tax=Lacibacterium aquatile TaxID=1168082 RepID=A0ABW5DN56_9PROT